MTDEIGYGLRLECSMGWQDPDPKVSWSFQRDAAGWLRHAWCGLLANFFSSYLQCHFPREVFLQIHRILYSFILLFRTWTQNLGNFLICLSCLPINSLKAGTMSILFTVAASAAKWVPGTQEAFNKCLLSEINKAMKWASKVCTN